MESGQVKIVHYGDNTAAIPSIAGNAAHHLKLVRDVEARDGLVKQEPARAVCLNGMPNLNKDPGKMRPLLFAARQFLEEAILLAAKPDFCKSARRKKPVVPMLTARESHSHDYDHRERKGEGGRLR